MEPKTILALLAAAAFFYFRFGPGSRLLKKKSHHHIVPPSPTQDANWHPIDFSDYDKFLFIDNNSLDGNHDHLQKVLIDNFSLEIESSKIISKWLVLNLNNSSFGAFHGALSFCSLEYSNDTYAFCKHKNNSSNDYVVKTDFDSEVSHLIGAFRTNQNFGIYLPNVSKNNQGNISISKVSEVHFETFENLLEIQKFRDVY